MQVFAYLSISGLGRGEEEKTLLSRPHPEYLPHSDLCPLSPPTPPLATEAEIELPLKQLPHKSLD
jgi:hypothetical protein